MISIIVPTLNEELLIGGTLRTLIELPGEKEILVADGASTDRTVEIARALGIRVIEGPRGRGSQMGAAADKASGGVLWFVHADARPERGALEAIGAALRDPGVAGGNFTLSFDGAHYSSRQMTFLYPYLRWLGLSYGDAGIFARREVYLHIGGFRPYPIFEDLDLARRLKGHGRFVHLSARIAASPRRFSGERYFRTWVLWIVLQVLFWLGVSPYRLGAWYRVVR